MSSPCSFLEDTEGCLGKRKQIFTSHNPAARIWEPLECENCKLGRDRAMAHIPPEPDEEESMPEKMTTKEKVLAAIGRRGSASPTILMQVCKVSADALRVLVGELEREGELKVWPYRSRKAMTALYTLPDAKDPRTPEMLEAKASPAPAKKAPTPREPVVRNRKPAAPSNGNGAYAAVIADLEAERTKALDRVEQIDTAIATLRALA